MRRVDPILCSSPLTKPCRKRRTLPLCVRQVHPDHRERRPRFAEQRNHQRSITGFRYATLLPVLIAIECILDNDSSCLGTPRLHPTVVLGVVLFPSEWRRRFPTAPNVTRVTSAFLPCPVPHGLQYSPTAGGDSVLDCNADCTVQGDSVVLTSLALNAVVTCTGSHVITAADIDNLERKSSASVTAVDAYFTEVEAAATVTVGLDQVCWRGP